MKGKFKVFPSVFAFGIMLIGFTIPASAENIHISSFRNIVAGTNSNVNATNLNIDNYTGWQVNINGNLNYYKDGVLQTGWLRSDNNWYHFDNSGILKTGWFKDADGKWYYFDIYGNMLHDVTVDGCKLSSSGYWIEYNL